MKWMEHIPMTLNYINLAIRVLQKVQKLKFFFMTADLYSWIIDFSMRKCMHPKKQKNLHEMDGTYPNDTQ